MIKRQIATAALVTFGLFIALEYKSVAQQQPTTQPSPRTTEQTGSQLSALDRLFMIQAAQGGMAEVMLGKLATQRASSQSVRDYAQQMIKEHTQANNELMKLAKAKGVTLPKTVNAQQQAVMSQLSKLSGEQFETAYMNEGGIRSHAEQEALYQREVDLGQDRDVQAFAAKILPTVQDHLQMAREMTGSAAGANQKPQVPAQ